ncbi:MAG: autotransporter-associated beta strand repeat-containing protein [Chthoniobacterales bacterium]
MTSGTAGLTFGATTLTGDTSFNITSSILTLASVSGSGNITEAGNGGGQFVIPGTIATGTGSITVSSGTLTLSGNNSYSGGTSIGGATTVNATNSNALGTGNVAVNGTLQLSGDSALTLGNTVSSSSGGTFASDRLTNGAGVTHNLGALTAGNNVFTSIISVNAGSHVTSGTAGISFTSAVLNGDLALNIANSAQLTLGSVTGTDTNLFIQAGYNGNLNIIGNIDTGAGFISLQSNSIVTLSGTNSYSGGTYIFGGTMKATNNSALGTDVVYLGGGWLNLASDSALHYSNNVEVGYYATIFSDRATAGAGVTHIIDTMLFDDAYSLTVSKGANVTSGTAGLSIGAVTLTTDGASFAPDSGVQLTIGTITGTDTGWSNNGNGAITVTGAMSLGAGSVSQNGGTLTLNSSNSYSGGTDIASGTLRITNSGAMGSGNIAMDGGTLTLADDTGLTLSNASTVPTNSTITSDRLTSGAGITHTLGTLSIGARTLTVNKGANVSSGTAGITYGAVTLTGNATFKPSTGTLLTLASVTGTNRSFSDTGAGNLTIPGIIATGSGTVTQSGTGNLTLNGTNTYTGGFTATGGTTTIGNTKAFGTGTLTLNGGTIKGDGSDYTLANVISLAAASTISGASNLTFSGALTNSLTANTLTNNGTGDLSLAAINISNSNTARGITFAGTGDTEITGVIANGGTGAGAITKTGAGTLTLSGTANTYTGVTTITSGILSTATFAAGGSNSGIGKAPAAGGNIVLNGGTLQYTGAAVSTDRLFTVTTGGGALDASGTGAVNFSNTGALLYTTTGARTLTLTGTNTGANTLASILANGPSTSVTAMTKTGAGKWILSGANTYTGVTTVTAGTLSTASFANGGTASGIGKATNAGGNLVLNGGTLQYTGAAVSTNRLFTVTASGGALDASGSGAVNFTGTGPTLFSGSGTRTLTLTGSNAGANTLAAVLGDGTGGATSLTKTGDGTWVLSGANTYTGLVNVSDGLLSINAIAANGTAQPLGKGTGAITLGDTATLRYTSNSAATLARALTVSAGTGTISNTGSGVLTLSGTLTKANTVLAFSGGKFDISGQITGGTGSTFNSDLVINNATDITLDNTDNDYAGPTYVYGGAALRNGANNVLPLGTTLTLGDATDGAVTNTYDLNTHTQSIGAITSVSHGGNINKITNAGSSAATLTLTGIQGAITPVSSNFGGTLVDGLSGTTALTLSGGTHKFTGANTYSGGTTVAAGAKFIASNTTGSATGVGNVNIAVGATLAGSGILAPTGTNSITVLGTLAPGDIEVINTLSLDGSSNSAAHLLTLGTGATLEFDLDVSLASDRIALLSNSVGGISFNDNVINFTDLSDGNLAYGSYTLFTAPNLTDYSGLTVDGNGNIIGGLTIGTGVSDFNANLSYSGNNIVLNLAAVPEPSTWLLLVIGFSGLFFVRKKKFVKIL